MEITKVKGVIGSIIAIAALGWGGHEIVYDRPTHMQVANSLNESDYVRYEERIEELQQDKIELQFKNAPLTPREVKMIELYEDRIQKYEKRQKRLEK